MRHRQGKYRSSWYALVLCTALSGCTTPDFGDSEAGLALEDLASGLSTSRLAALAPQPSRESISFITGGEERAADLYRPSRSARAGIVLVPGVVAQGRRDARIIAMANTLARLDFTVLVPDMPGVRSYQMRSGDVREVADTFAWLASRPELAPPGTHYLVAGADPVSSLAPSEAKKEIDLSIEDLRDLLPGFDSHAEILMTGCYHGNWPAMFSIAGQSVSPRTPIENLYAVGDGFIAEPGMTAMVGAAGSGVAAAKEIAMNLKPGG